MVSCPNTDSDSSSTSKDESELSQDSESRTETSFFLSYPNTQSSVVSKILQRKNKKRKESIFIVVV